MKILYLNPSVELGGGERSLLELVSGLDRARFTPLASCVGEGPLPDALRSAGAQVHVNPWPRFALRIGRGRLTSRLMAPLAAPALVPHIARTAALVRREKLDLILTNGLKSHLIGSAVSRLTGRPLVWHVRDVLRPGPIRRFYGALARMTVSRLVANSRAVADTFPGMPPSRLSVIYNGLDMGRYSPGPPDPSVRAALGIGEDDFVIGAIGALAPLKGHIHLIRAAPAILERCPHARIVIVGREMYVTAGHAGYRRELEAEAARLGVAPRIAFAGYHDDTVAVLRCFDILVHSSVYPESFGRVIVEAMACGVPVVATALGGPTEIIRSEEEGLLIPAENPAAIAAAVTSLVEDPARRERMARKGRERAEVAFSVSRYVREVQELYDLLRDAR